MSNLTDPSWLDTGDNAWQLTASSLVGLQSVPGLVILYGGIVKRKWAINSAFMAFYAFQAVLITWVLWAYKMGFGEQWAPFVGVPGPMVTISNELEQALLPASNTTATFSDGDNVLFSVRLRCHYCDHHGWCLSRVA